VWPAYLSTSLVRTSLSLLGVVNGGHEMTSLLIRYFHHPLDPIFTPLTYADYFQQYVLYCYDPKIPLKPHEFIEGRIGKCTQNKVCPRQIGVKVTRLQTISPTAGEVFYLRCLLAHHAACSFVEVRTIDGIVHSTFHQAALHLGLFTNENEGHYAMLEAVSSYCTPAQLRFLFS
jgi:hypothetical protein